MLKIGCLKQNYWISGMPQGIPMQSFAQQWWTSGYCNQFHTYSQWFATNFIISKISIAGKCIKMLKIGWFIQNYCISGIVSQACIPMQFFPQQWWKSGYCEWFHTYSQWFAANFIFSKISIAGKCTKCLKMLKIGCFKQNYFISGIPQGIPMQFFAQQWWKSGYCDQFHTYTQWFAANFIISKISIAGKCIKCLK